jgi:hypothetical protein
MAKAKAKINPPGHSIEDSRYQPECQFALEPSVTKLLQLAEQAGWDPHQAAYAVMMLAAQAMTASPATELDVDRVGTSS